MRFKLNYTYETMCNYWIKVAGISSADFDDLMQVGDRWIDEMSNIPDA